MHLKGKSNELFQCMTFAQYLIHKDKYIQNFIYELLIISKTAKILWSSGDEILKFLHCLFSCAVSWVIIMDIFDETFAIDTGIFIEVVLISASRYIWKCTVVEKLFELKKIRQVLFKTVLTLFDLILW